MAHPLEVAHSAADALRRRRYRTPRRGGARVGLGECGRPHRRGGAGVRRHRAAGLCSVDRAGALEQHPRVRHRREAHAGVPRPRASLRGPWCRGGRARRAGRDPRRHFSSNPHECVRIDQSRLRARHTRLDPRSHQPHRAVTADRRHTTAPARRSLCGYECCVFAAPARHRPAVVARRQAVVRDF